MKNSSRVAESNGPLEIEGYLRKMQIKKRYIHNEKTKLKYFKISLKDRGKFCYSNHKSIRSWRREITFDEFIKLIPNLDDSHRNLSEFKYGFQLQTKQKNYVLFCEEEIFHYEWVRVLEYIINKTELTYDHYEKYIKIKEGHSEWFHSRKYIDKDENSNDQKLDFSFNNNISKKYENILDESNNKINNILKTDSDNLTFKDRNSNKIENKPKYKESTNIIEYNKFKELNKEQKISGDNNDYCPLDWNYVFQPKYVDTNSSKPINELRKYKILKTQDEIKSQEESSRNKLKSKIQFQDNISFMDRLEKRGSLIFIGANPDENKENDINTQTKKDEAYCDSDDVNEHSIDLFVDKGEIKDFINFNYENINTKKHIKSQSEKPLRLHNLNSISYQGEENNFEIFKELFDDTDSYNAGSSKSAQDKFDFTKKESITEKSSENIIEKSKIFKSMNTYPLESNYLERILTEKNSEKTKYVHKKISVSNNSLNNINFNSRYSSKNHKTTNENGIYASTDRSFTNVKKDIVFENGNEYDKSHDKNENKIPKILNFGVDNFKMTDEDIKNTSMDSYPQNNLNKVVVKDDTQFKGDQIKKKETMSKRLNHENSLIVLKNMKNAPTNNNIISEETLVEEGNQWVMNLKIIKNEKF